MKHLQIPLFVLITLSFILAGCHFPGKPWVQVEITNLEEGQLIPQYEELNIITNARSSTGIDRVELYINGELENQTEPPMGHPKEFTAEQALLPLVEGPLIISVVAIDKKGTTSQPTSLILNVGTPIEGALTSTPTIEFSPEEIAQTQTAQAGCMNSASFVEHVTIPPGTNLSAGSSFTKIWRVSNNGTCEWAGYQLTLTSGDSMGASSPRALPVVKPGANADIVVDMVAPASGGTFSAGWRIQAGDGTIFGPELPLTVNVSVAPTKTFTPTIAPTFTPTTTTAPTSTPTFSLPIVTIPPIITIPPILLINVQQVSEELTIAGNTTNNRTVTCPSGGVVVSGGFSSPGDVFVWHSMKDGNGWRVYATNKSSDSKTIIITASCLFNSSGSSDSIVEQVNINASEVKDLTAACPSGSIVTGGGWVLNNNSANKVLQSGKSGNGWQIRVSNATTSNQLTNLYAICLSGVSGSTTQVSVANNTVPGFGSSSTQANCPSSAVVTGGGFKIPNELTLTNTTMSSNGWINYVLNGWLFEKNYDSYAICYQP